MWGTTPSPNLRQLLSKEWMHTVEIDERHHISDNAYYARCVVRCICWFSPFSAFPAQFRSSRQIKIRLITMALDHEALVVRETLAGMVGGKDHLEAAAGRQSTPRALKTASAGSE